MANFCSNCGSNVMQGMKFCSVCGQPVINNTTNINNNQGYQQMGQGQTPPPMTQPNMAPNQMPPRMTQPNVAPNQMPPRMAQPNMAPNQMPPQMQYRMPPQMSQPVGQVKPKKKSKVNAIPLIILIVFFVIEIIVEGLLVTGIVIKTNKKKVETADTPQYHEMDSDETNFEDMNNSEALLDYARKLEEQGNFEAAGVIYEKLPDSYMNDILADENNESQIKKDEKLIDAEEKTEMIMEIFNQHK